MPVGGSRHYGGSGLGQEGIWGCPSCGEDNAGPISQGCSHCGAGRPGHKAPPAPPPPVVEVEEPSVLGAGSYQQGDVADWWAREHPEATVAEAYRAGLVEGIRAARAATERTPPAAEYVPDQKINRTLIVALAFFRDKVLAEHPEEIDTGEWLSVEEATLLIRRLQLEIQEPAHA